MKIERAFPPLAIIALARSAATMSPCRSQRGAVVFVGEQMLAGACNRPPRDNRSDEGQFACDGSDACKARCRQTALHAEQIAILDALGRRLARGGRFGDDTELLHVKVVDGAIVASGPPSCTQCSKIALEYGISRVWLLHADGWRWYTTAEFHALSIENDPTIGAKR